MRKLLLTLTIALTFFAAFAQDDPTPTLDEITILARSPFPAPTPRENNAYLQKIEADLGVRLNFEFVPSSEFAARLGTVFASGDLPDLVVGAPSDYPIILQAVEQGAFVSLEDAGLLDALKDPSQFPGISQYPEIIWQNSAVNGKVYGVPTGAQQYQNGSFIRTDWLENLGLDIPTTAEELENVLVAFTTQDPDGNGVNDTFGACLSEGGTWTPFLEAFGVPSGWKVQGDGTLLNSQVSDEMRAAVSYMHNLYEQGVFDTDFPALGVGDMYTQFIEGRCGLLPQNLASGYDLQGAQLRELEPDAEVYPIDPVVADGYERVTYLRPGFNTTTQISVEYRNEPEKIRDLLTIIDYFVREDTRDFVNFGFEGVNYTVNEDGSFVQTEQGKNDIGWIRAWGPRHYERVVNAPYVLPATREQILKDTERLSAYGIADPTWGVFPELGMDDPTAVLNDFSQSTFIRMITGDQSLDEWNAYVEDWYSRGGRELTDATTTAYNRVKSQ